MFSFLIDKGENEVRKVILIVQDVKDKAMIESRVIFNILYYFCQLGHALHQT